MCERSNGEEGGGEKSRNSPGSWCPASQQKRVGCPWVVRQGEGLLRPHRFPSHLLRFCHKLLINSCLPPRPFPSCLSLAQRSISSVPRTLTSLRSEGKLPPPIGGVDGVAQCPSERSEGDRAMALSYLVSVLYAVGSHAALSPEHSVKHTSLSVERVFKQPTSCHKTLHLIVPTHS